MPHPDADRNLLFGINALQNDFITRDALIAAMGAWALAKHRPIGEILVEARALNPADRDALEAMIARRLARHGDDPAAGLAALSSARGVADEIRRSISDPDVLRSVSYLPPDSNPGTADAYATRSTAAPEPPPSAVRFRKVREHAAGNLGVVYVARDEELNREVALKEIKEKNADHLHSQAKFLLEAEVTGGLEHPGIVPVYGLGHHDDGRPFYAMRFIRGKSLHDAIKRFHADDSLKKDPGQRLLALQKLLRRFTDVCNAVAYAHSRGVLHRDLKPDNVMVGKYGETLVVDWGLAKALGHSGEPSGTITDPDDPLPEASLQPSSSDGMAATQAGSLVGTPAYMSPEQAAGRLDLLGPASDIYGLGATLYHLIVGRPPIEARTLGDLLAKIQSGKVSRPQTLAPWLDPALEAICLKAMALKPEARYATARALAEDLDRWIAGEPVAAYPEPWTRRARRWARIHRTALAIAATAATAVALVLGSVAWLRIGQREKVDASAFDALVKAEGTAYQAREERDPRKMQLAIAMARQALDGLEAGGGSPDLHRRIEARYTTFQVEAARFFELGSDWRHRRTVEALEEARISCKNINDDQIGYDAIINAYMSAFRAYGIDVSKLPVEEAARQVRSSPISDDLMSALNDWASHQPTNVPALRLRAIAGAAETGSWRPAIREAVVRHDLYQLRQLCERNPPDDRTLRGPQLRYIFDSVLQLDPERIIPILDVIRREHPSDFWLNHDLGLAYASINPPQLQDAVRCLAVAVGLRPDSAGALVHLGQALQAMGKTNQAVDEYLHALSIRPNYAEAHYSLGNARLSQGRHQDAVNAYSEALRFRPDHAAAHYYLGKTRFELGMADQAIAEFREALRIRPEYAEAHCGLGLALFEKGFFREALDNLERGHKLGSLRSGWTFPSKEWVQEARRIVELEGKVSATLKGEATPRDADERLALADACYRMGRHAAAVRFAGEAFVEQPATADDLAKGVRYIAACSAALAGSGQGKDDPAPDEAGRARLREKALGWLRADLASWSKVLERGNEPARMRLDEKLRRWKEDPDLAGIRDEAALAKLPEGEREAFRTLWVDVEALRKKAAGAGSLP